MLFSFPSNVAENWLSNNNNNNNNNSNNISYRRH